MPTITKVNQAGEEVEYDVNWLPGEIIPGRVATYRIDNFVAKGGMGRVYRATVIKSRNPSEVGQARALKFLRLAAARELKGVERFETESGMLLHLRHKHLVGVYDFGTVHLKSRRFGEHDIPFFAMELLAAYSLRHVIRYLKRLEPVLAYGMMHHLCEVVVYVDAQGIVHRDIKPDNVFVQVDEGRWTWKLGDFGIAKNILATGVPLTQEGAIIGSPDYMPAEQCRGLPATVRNDVYAIGAVLFTALTGMPPFAQVARGLDLVRLLNSKNPPPAPLISEFGSFHPRVVELAARCLSHNPEERPGVLELAQKFFLLKQEAEAVSPADLQRTHQELDKTINTMAADDELARQIDKEEAERSARLLDAEGITYRRDTELSPAVPKVSAGPPKPATKQEVKLPNAASPSPANDGHPSPFGFTAKGTLLMFARALRREQKSTANGTPVPVTNVKGNAQNAAWLEANALRRLQQAEAPTKGPGKLVPMAAGAIGLVLVLGVSLSAMGIRGKALKANASSEGPSAVMASVGAAPTPNDEGRVLTPIPKTTDSIAPDASISPKVVLTAQDPAVRTRARSIIAPSPSLTPAPKTDDHKVPVSRPASAIRPTAPAVSVADQARAMMLRDPTAAKALLLKQLAAGKSTSEERGLLRTICKDQHDQECLRRTGDELEH